MTPTNSEQSIVGLVNQMVRIKKGGTPPYALVIGSDAAPAPFETIETSVLREAGYKDGQIADDPVDRAEQFKQAWRQLAMDVRFNILYEGYEPLPAGIRYGQVVMGYRGIARLCQAGYIDVIFTTNVDTMLEDALISIGLTPRHWSVFVNGKDDLEKIRQGLAHDVPRVKIIKLHGDLFTRVLAFTDDEVDEFTRKVQPLLEEYLAKPVLIVGHTLRDQAIDRCLATRGETLYYVKPTRPPQGTVAYTALRARQGVVISGEEAQFGNFFDCLSRKLVGGDQPEEVGVDTLAKVGIDITRMPDEQVVSALTSNKPVIEFITELQEKQPAMSQDELILDVLTPTTFRIRYDTNQRVSFTIEGALNYASEPSETVRLDAESLNRMLWFMGENIRTYHLLGQTSQRVAWREQARREGSLLFEKFFEDLPDLMQKFGMARQATGDGANLQLLFEGPRNLLGMPYELLHDGQPLVVRYALARQVTGVPARGLGFRDLLTALRKQKQKLRILLISCESNGIKSDKETADLALQLKGQLDALRVDHEIKRVPTAEADRATVEKLLTRCPYHVVHYAGHGYFDAEKPEQSALLLKGKKGDEILTALTLGQRLQGSQTILCYLSCCVGAAVGGAQLLGANQYLGLLDAVAQAGVPVALGYRWYVKDSSARQFALDFYKSLFETQSPPQAALHARREAYLRDADDETWTSPILIAQRV